MLMDNQKLLLTTVSRCANNSSSNEPNQPEVADSMKAIVLIFITSCVIAATDAWVDVSKLDLEHVNCHSQVDMIDECGLQQGFSRRFEEFTYPQNFSALMTACKRQASAFKCLRAYAKCLPTLSKQVLLSMVQSRQKFNKKICGEKQSEQATQLIALSTCMAQSQVGHQKGLKAELNSIAVPEAIVESKIATVQDRLKYSCGCVAQLRREFMEAIVPHCKQYSQIASDMIDSYLAETVGIICPDMESKTRDCDKLSKLPTSNRVKANFFVRPIINVVQSLAA